MKELLKSLRWESGWMDSISYDHELGNASGGTKIYASEEDLRENERCIGTDGHCWPIRVFVISEDELKRFLSEDEIASLA